MTRVWRIGILEEDSYYNNDTAHMGLELELTVQRERRIECLIADFECY